MYLYVLYMMMYFRSIDLLNQEVGFKSIKLVNTDVRIWKEKN